MKIQPLHNSSLPTYSADPKARARLAAALGLAASLGLAACQDDPLSSDPQSGDVAVTDTLSASSSSMVSSEEWTAGGIAYSSSSAISSSSVQDTLPVEVTMGGDIAMPLDTIELAEPVYPDTLATKDTLEGDILIAEPTAGVIMLPMSFSTVSSSSKAPSSSSTSTPSSSSATAGVVAQPDEE